MALGSDIAAALGIKITADDQTKEGFNSAETAAQHFAGSLKGIATEIVGDFAGVVAAVVSAEKAIELLGEGIKKADEIRDLQFSLQALSSSTTEGTKAWQFFEEAQKETRATAEELAKVYRDVLPLAIRRFGEEGTREITLMLSQITPIAGKTVQELDDAFKQLLAGRVRGTNPLLVSLGMTKEQFADAGFDGLIVKLSDLAERGKALGDTFESAGHKVKETLFDEFGQGFNDSRGGADALLKSIKDDLLSPEVLGGVRQLGGFIADFGDFFGAANTAAVTFHETLNSIATSPVWLHGLSGLYNQNATSASTPEDMQLRRQSDINAAKIQSGIKSVTGYGGSQEDFFAQFGEFIRSHSAEDVAKALESVHVEVKKGVISWTDYTSSIAWAQSHIRELPTDHKDATDTTDKHAASVRAAAEAYREFAASIKEMLGDQVSLSALLARQRPGQVAPSKGELLGIMAPGNPYDVGPEELTSTMSQFGPLVSQRKAQLDDSNRKFVGDYVKASERGAPWSALSLAPLVALLGRNSARVNTNTSSRTSTTAAPDSLRPTTTTRTTPLTPRSSADTQRRFKAPSTRSTMRSSTRSSRFLTL